MGFKATQYPGIPVPDTRDFLNWTWMQSCELHAQLSQNLGPTLDLPSFLEHTMDSKGKGFTYLML